MIVASEGFQAGHGQKGEDLSAVSQLAVERFTPRNGKFSAHSHDEYIISVNGPGVLREQISLDRESFDVGTEEITVYNPGQIQTSITKTRNDAPWECFSVHVDAATVSQLTGVDSFAATAPFFRDRGLAVLIRQTSEMTDTAAAAETALWIVAEALHRSAEDEKAIAEHDNLGNTPDLTSITERMRDGLSEPINVTDAAATLSLSPQQFIRAFKKVTGLTPYAWHLHLRLQEGRRLLRRGTSVTEAALGLGFSDQAHFHRHFVSAYAQTPGVFRMSVRE